MSFKSEMKYWLTFSSRLVSMLAMPMIGGFITYLMTGFFIEIFLVILSSEIIYLYYDLVKKKEEVKN